jgi:hypothetical protein
MPFEWSALMCMFRLAISARRPLGKNSVSPPNTRLSFAAFPAPMVCSMIWPGMRFFGTCKWRPENLTNNASAASPPTFSASRLMSFGQFSRLIFRCSSMGSFKREGYETILNDFNESGHMKRFDSCKQKIFESEQARYFKFNQRIVKFDFDQVTFYTQTSSGNESRKIGFHES